MNKLPQSKPATRDDVARHAGVSPAVVSYVVNSSKNVSDEKRAAVLRAIEELNYRPNLHARSLKTRRSMQIAFVCDNLRNDWLELPEKILFDKGYYVSHCFSRDGDGFIDMLIQRGFDGVFMMSNRYTAQQLRRLPDAGIPVVLYKTKDYGDLGEGIVTVVPDIYGGIVKCVNFLALHGHRRIALLLPARYRSVGIRGGGFREHAYVDAVQANGLELDDALFCTDTASSETILRFVCETITEHSAAKRPTAFLAGNDFIAAQVVQAVKKLGLRVPEDVAVIGFDNTYLATMITPALTSVDFSKDEFADRLTETMLRLIEGQRAEDAYIHTAIVVREST